MNILIKTKMLRRKIMNLVAVFIILSSFFTPNYHVSAASLTLLSDTLSRLKVGEDANHLITFTTPSGVAAGGTIIITFPSDFSTTSVDYTDIDVAVGGTDLTLAAAPNLTTWGVAFGGTGNRTLTITSGTGTIAGSSVVTIEIGTNAANGVTGDQAINNPTTNNTFSIGIAGSFGDIGSIVVVILIDDQIAVTGTIDNTLSFSISDIAIGFGSFASTNVRYATDDALGSASEPGNDLPTKLTAATNTIHGLSISISDQGNGTSSGLYSSSASELIPAAASTAVTNNSKKYGVYGKNASGLAIHESFDNDLTSDLAISRAPQTFVSAAAPVNNGSVDVALLAATDATTKAGVYQDTLTLICTGNY